MGSKYLPKLNFCYFREKKFKSFKIVLLTPFMFVASDEASDDVIANLINMQIDLIVM